MKKLFSSILFLCSTMFFAQPGTLDGDFDADGILVLDVFDSNEYGTDVVIQPDGKILVCVTI